MTTQQTEPSNKELFRTSLGELSKLIAAVKTAENKAEHSVRQAGFKQDQGGYRLFTLFKNAPEDEKPELIKALEKALPDGFKINKATGAEGAIVKMLVGTVNWRVSAKLGLYEELYRDGIKPDEYVDHLNKFGEQNIKLARQERLRKEKGLDAEEAAKPRTKALTKQQRAESATRALAAMKDNELATVSIPNLEHIPVDTPFMVMGVRRADGTFVVKAPVTDVKACEMALVSIGTNLPEETDEQRLIKKAEQLEELAKQPTLNLTTIKKEVDDETAAECEEKWQCQQDQLAEFECLPPAVIEYERVAKKGDFEDNKRTDSGGNETVRASEILLDAHDADKSIAKWFDRPIDRNMLGWDTESRPRLRNSKSKHNLKPLKMRKKDALRMFCLQTAGRIRSSISSAPINISAMSEATVLIKDARSMLNRVRAF
jgi:hypothetical protein